MENGFAKMTLLNTAASATAAIPLAPTGYQMPQPQFPSAERLEAKEVRMKSRSWFEPERDRIVVLDLEASDTEDDTEVETNPTSSSRSSTKSPIPLDDTYSVSNAYLSRLSAIPKPPTPPAGLFGGRPLGELVLYKAPSMTPGFQSLSYGSVHNDEDFVQEYEEDDGPELFASIEEVDDDDDVQMMDVDQE